MGSRRQELQVGGTVDPSRHLYIERKDIENEVYRLLSRGEYCNILCSRQVGKSSLMTNNALRLRTEGTRVAVMDVAGELGTSSDPTTWYKGLLEKLRRELRMRVAINDWWEHKGQGTANQRLLQFFRDHVCAEHLPPCVVFLDEIESTLEHDYTDDFFTAIRTMFNERPIEPCYERVTFCLIGVASPNELIKDPRTTPYNVGRTIELRDFDGTVDDLNLLFESVAASCELGKAMVLKVLSWTGGHPYLTLRLCQEIIEQRMQTPTDLDRFVETKFSNFDRVRSDVHFREIERFLGTRVSDKLAVLGLYGRIASGERVRDETAPSYIQLKLSGLVKRDPDGCLVIRNRIYERLFNNRWIASQKPSLRMGFYRRWAIGASAAFVIISAVSIVFLVPTWTRLSRIDDLARYSLVATQDEVRNSYRVVAISEVTNEELKSALPLLKALGPITELRLSDTSVSDVRPLAALTNLQVLHLSDTEVEHLRPLEDLAELEILALRSTPVSDLRPLAGLQKLRKLHVSSTAVTDIRPLAALTNLEELSLSSTEVSDLSPIAGLVKLRTLSLLKTDVSDLAPLSNLVDLRTLSLSATDDVSNVRPLAALTNLEELSLSSTKDSDANLASLLGKLKKLEKLHLASTRISDLSPVGSLKQLRSLELRDTQVFDIEPLRDLHVLTYLGLSTTQVSDVGPLAAQVKLEVLDASNTLVSDVQPLAALTNLQELFLSSTRISDLSPLDGLVKLETLHLQKTDVLDLTPLNKLVDLRTLDLSATLVSDVRPLAGLTNLQELFLSSTKVSDLSPLDGLGNLQRLEPP